MRPRHAVLLAALLVGLAPTAAHGILKLYAADAESARIWGFAGIEPFVITRAGSFGGVQDMAIASDGRILVASAAGRISAVSLGTGGVEDLVTGVAPLELYPDGESTDIYFVKDDSVSLWVLPGGGGTAESCMTFRGPVLDLLVAPMGPRKGHVIALIGARGDTLPYIAEYERTGPTTFTELDPIVEEATANAIDLALRPNGALVLLDRAFGLHNVGPDGGLQQFGPGHIGAGSDDMDIGSDGTIYVASASMCRIHRLNPMGQIINPALTMPNACPSALVALGFTPTPPGAGVQVNPAEHVELRLESVAEGGYSSAVLTESASRTSPQGNTLPFYAALPDGETVFTYVGLSSTATHENLIQADALMPGTRLFACASSGSSRGMFRDVTVEGSIEDARGVISRFDEFVLVVDNRPAGDVADNKFGMLDEILVPGADDPQELQAAKAELEVYADQAFAYYGSYLYAWAIDELSAMNAVIRGYAGSVIPNSPAHPLGNLAGEMLSRSKTLMFTLGLLTPPTDVPGVPVAGEAAYSLSYASPSRDECRLELAGPAAGRVTVTVCTTAGRVVRTLYDGPFAGGRATIVWDGTDDAGQRAASGVYFARVESGGEAATGKVVLIR